MLPDKCINFEVNSYYCCSYITIEQWHSNVIVKANFIGLSEIHFIMLLNLPIITTVVSKNQYNRTV